MPGPRFQILTTEQDGEVVVNATLHRPADHCYRLFCDADRIPEWLWVVDTAIVQERDESNRALRVDFMGALERASIGYTLRYAYSDDERRVSWHHEGRGVEQLFGSARFISLPDGGCQLEYRLDTRITEGLPPWADELYRTRPAESVVIDFCEYVERDADIDDR